MAERYEKKGIEELQSLTEELINEFPQRFIHIKVNDIHFAFKDAATSSWLAQTRLLSGFYQTLTEKKLSIATWKANWLTVTRRDKLYILYHELMHIAYDKEKQVYKLIPHDVKTFYSMLKEFGIDREKSDDVFKNLLNK